MEKSSPDTPNLLGLTLQQLAYLQAIDRQGTLTAAARAAGVSQSALSQAVAEMERRLGVRLLEKAGRRRVFTEPGHEILRFADETLGRAGELHQALEARREGRAGRLRVGMIDAASLYLLPEAISAFREAHPGVQLQLVVDRSGVLLEQLGRMELDLAFVVGPLAPELQGRVTAREVRREPLSVYAPGGARERPQDADWLLYPRGSRTRALIDAGLAQHDVQPRVSLESNNPDVLRQMVALGQGWTVLPSGVAERGPAPLRRHRLGRVAARPLIAAWRPGAPAPAAAAFLDRILGTDG